MVEIARRIMEALQEHIAHATLITAVDEPAKSG